MLKRKKKEIDETNKTKERNIWIHVIKQEKDKMQIPLTIKIKIIT